MGLRVAMCEENARVGEAEVPRAEVVLWTGVSACMSLDWLIELLVKARSTKNAHGRGKPIFRNLNSDDRYLISRQRRFN